MKQITVLLAFLGLMGFATLAFSEGHEPAPEGNANGVYGCKSGGATADNPGHWFQELKDHPLLEGMNPAELAEKENTTDGWAGFEETPTVGAYIDFFCGNPEQ